MISIERLTGDDWQTLRDLRLRALGEAPYAFWATRADESRLSESDWRRFLRAAAWFVVRQDRELLGMAAGLLRGDDPAEPELIGMWVVPDARGQGVGGTLVDAVLAWARSVGASTVSLWVTDGNAAARRLYERVGFRCTGERGSMPHDAADGMDRMRVVLDP